jgi:hypothetical protein
VSCLILSDAPDLGVQTRWIDLPVPQRHPLPPVLGTAPWILRPPAESTEDFPGVQALLPDPRAARNLAAGDVAQSPLFQSHGTGGIFPISKGNDQ